jgi:hypothetical protein
MHNKICPFISVIILTGLAPLNVPITQIPANRARFDIETTRALLSRLVFNDSLGKNKGVFAWFDGAFLRPMKLRAHVNVREA